MSALKIDAVIADVANERLVWWKTALQALRERDYFVNLDQLGRLCLVTSGISVSIAAGIIYQSVVKAIELFVTCNMYQVAYMVSGTGIRLAAATEATLIFFSKVLAGVLIVGVNHQMSGDPPEKLHQDLLKDFLVKVLKLQRPGIAPLLDTKRFVVNPPLRTAQTAATLPRPSAEIPEMDLAAIDKALMEQFRLTPMQASDLRRSLLDQALAVLYREAMPAVTRVSRTIGENAYKDAPDFILSWYAHSPAVAAMGMKHAHGAVDIENRRACEFIARLQCWDRFYRHLLDERRRVATPIAMHPSESVWAQRQRPPM